MKHSRHLRIAQAGVTLASTLALIAGAHSASAQTFNPTDLVVSQVGNGSAALTNAGTTVFLDEFTQTGLAQTAQFSLALPTSATGTGFNGTTANNPFVNSGTATSEGALSLSLNGQYLTLSGYDATPGTTNTGNTSIAGSTVLREVAVVSGSGAIDTTTTLGSDIMGSSANPRGVSSPDGSTLIVGGATGGIYSTTIGSTSGGTLIESTDKNIRNVNLTGTSTSYSTYFSSESGSYTGVNVLGSTGTPPYTPTLIAKDTSSAYGFYFASPTVLYVADSTNGLERIIANGSGSFTGTGATTTVLGGAGLGLTGLTGITTTTGGVTSTTLYAVDPSSLVSFTDTGDSSGTNSVTPITLASAGTNEAFRGVAFAPSAGISPAPEPGEWAVLSLCGLGLGGVILRRRVKKTAEAAA